MNLENRSARAPVLSPQGEYPFSVLPASCRQNETVRDRKTCRRDAGSTLEHHHEAPLNRYQGEGADRRIA